MGHLNLGGYLDAKQGKWASPINNEIGKEKKDRPTATEGGRRG